MNEEALKKLERKRKFFRFQFIILPVIFVIGVFLSFGIIQNLNYKGPLNVIGYFWGVFCIIWIIILVYCSGKLVKQLTDKLMHLVLKDEFATFSYNVNKGVPEQLFKHSKFIYYYDDYTSSNYISGRVDGGKQFAMSNIAVSVETTDSDGNTSSHTVFKGIFAVLETGQANGFELTIAPDVKNKYINQLLNSIKKMGGVKNIVRLENVEFERYFEVYSDNQIEARKIITIEFMEKLMLLRKKLNKPITIIYKDSKIYLFAANLIIAPKTKLLFKGLTNEIIEETKNTIKDMYDTMKLL